MRIFTLIGFLALIVAGGANKNVFAQEAVTLPDEQADELFASVADFEKAVLRSDGDAMVGFLPPKVVAAIAKDINVSIAEVKSQIVGLLDSGSDTIEWAKMDIREDLATSWKLNDQSVFVRMPTEAELRISDGEWIRSKSETIAIMENGNWYLIGPDKAQEQALLRIAYPQFENIELQLAEYEVLDLPSGAE